MNDPVQIAPLLSIFSDDGEFTLRVDGSDLAKVLAPQITKAIGQVASARKLTLLTPTDTKIFKFNGADRRNQTPSLPSSEPEDRPLQDLPPAVVPSSSNATMRPHIVQDYSAPPAPEVAEQMVDEFDAELASQQKAEQEMRQAERTIKSDPQLPTDEEPVHAPRKRTPKERPTPLSVTACGRCGGQGQIAGGGTCPVCRGQKTIPHYGRRGR